MVPLCNVEQSVTLLTEKQRVVSVHVCDDVTTVCKHIFLNFKVDTIFILLNYDGINDDTKSYK